MIRKLLSILCLVAVPCLLLSQEKEMKYGKSVVFGSSITFIPDNESTTPGILSNKLSYHELTWATNVSVDFSKYFRMGVDLKKIFTRSLLNGRNNYYLLGLPGQFKFLHQPKFFLYATAGPYIGNYCTCGEDNPYKVKNLWYLNYGGGFNLRINEKFRANLGFTNANILTKTPGRYNFTQYLIALEYQLFLKEKKLEIRN